MAAAEEEGERSSQQAGQKTAELARAKPRKHPVFFFFLVLKLVYVTPHRPRRGRRHFSYRHEERARALLPEYSHHESRTNMDFLCQRALGALGEREIFRVSRRCRLVGAAHCVEP